MFFLFIKQGKSIAISLHFAIKVILTSLNNGILKRMAKVLRTIPGSSKHFFEIKTKLADAQTIVFIPKKSRHFKFNYNGYFSKNYQVKFY